MNDKTKNKYIRSNFWIIAIKEIKIGVIYIFRWYRHVYIRPENAICETTLGLHVKGTWRRRPFKTLGEMVRYYMSFCRVIDAGVKEQNSQR